MDIWVRRYCVDGTLRWTTQFGTVAEERIGGYGGQLGIDTIDGAVYIGGSTTQGAFYGADAEGACDGGLSGADCPYYSGVVTKISQQQRATSHTLSLYSLRSIGLLRPR